MPNKTRLHRWFTSYNFFERIRPVSNLNEAELDALENLTKNKNLVIQKADKGNTVVIINKNDNKTKIKNILSDSTKFKKLEFGDNKQLNFLINNEKKLKDVIKPLYQKECLTKKEYDSIYPTGSRPGILYGNAKVHKPIIDNCPSFRPILSAIGTPTYNLAKFLVPILSPLTVNEFIVHDSFSFAEEVVNFDANCIMASLDVESLFTNIPLDETIENCINNLFANNDTVHNFIKEDLKELLKFASYESFFTFDHEYYSQLDGVAMGSPLGPTLANAFLCHFEKQWLSNFPQDLFPNIYRRYVHDICVTSKSYEQLKKFVEYMDTKHANIKFTFEYEHNNYLSFLDVKICRENKKLTTSLYRKPTFSGVFTNFKSFIPAVYKFGLVYTLLHHCFNITSSYEKFHNEINALKQILKLNGYPTQLIDRCIKQFLQKL